MTPGRGRPVRFLAIVSVGWIGTRVVLLLPDAVAVVGQGASVLGVPRVVAAPSGNLSPAMPPRFPRSYPQTFPQDRPQSAAARRPDPAPVEMVDLALVAPVEPASAAPVAVTASAGPLLARPDLPPSLVRRGLTGSAWFAARGGAATGGPVQLGGGQAGVRVRLPIAAGDRVALVGRVAAPLAGRGSEAALGVEWRPGGGTVAIVAERRMALDGGADGTGLGVIAGIDRAIGERIVVEGYGQAGMVVRAGAEPYADGAVRMLYRVGHGRLRLGVGSWGVAQREGARVDIGPSAVAMVPLGGQVVRLSLDWRARVAGKAAPGSGIALTLGSDF